MSEVVTRSIRGAIDVSENTRRCILERSRELLQTILSENDVDVEDVIAILFTATADLDAIYPAHAARELGFTETALMCMQEMHVVGSLEKCLRVMVLWNSVKKQNEMRHVYLGQAARLRPDLIENNHRGGGS